MGKGVILLSSNTLDHDEHAADRQMRPVDESMTVDGTGILLRKIQYVLGLRSWHSEFG